MPLLFDMSWEDLQTYSGSTPRPHGFDDFWKKGLMDVESINPEVKFVHASFKPSFADCFDMYFTGVGGARIHAKLIRPKGVTDPHPAVLMFHGYTLNSGAWVDKLGYVATGFTVVALDCRGQGGLSEDAGTVKGTTMSGQIIRGLDDSPEKLLFRQIFLDTAQLAKIVMDMPDIDESRIGVTGASQGGGLALACASLVPNIKLVAPIFPFLSDYKRVWQIDQARDAYLELQKYFRHFDPMHEREDEVFTRLGYIDVQNLTPRIKGRVMMGVGLMDTICPPSTQFAAYNKIQSDKDVLVYPDFGHETLPGHSDAVFTFMSEL